jgi:hypothetical protein
MRTLRARVVLTAVLFGLPLPALAADPTPEDISTARSLGEEGQTALEAKDYQKAEDRFSRAYKLYPVATTLALGYARALAGNGKVVASQEMYNKIIREGVAPGAPPAFKNALEAAKNEVGAVSARVAGVVIDVTGCDNPKVTIDDAPVPSAVLGIRRSVDPGSHTVKATADGCNSAEQKFTVADGKEQTVSLKLEKSATAAPPVVAPVPSTAQPSNNPPAATPPANDTGVKVDTKGGSSNKTLAFVAFGVGGVGLLVGGITGAIAMGKKSDLDKACKGSVCGADQQSNVDSYHTMGTLSTVGFIAAGVGAAAGIILLVTAPKDTSTALGPKAEPRRAWISPYVGPTEIGATGRF